MTPKVSYKFTYKTTNPITQEEIDNLPPPPKEWLNEMEHEARERNILEDIYIKSNFSISGNEMVAWPYEKQLAIKNYLGGIIEKILDGQIDNEDDYWYYTNEFDSITTKLMNQKRPRNNTKKLFNSYMDCIRRAIHWKIDYSPPQLEDDESHDDRRMVVIKNDYNLDNLQELCWNEIEPFRRRMGWC